MAEVTVKGNVRKNRRLVGAAAEGRSDDDCLISAVDLPDDAAMR
jgi:hypothetical protein